MAESRANAVLMAHSCQGRGSAETGRRAKPTTPRRRATAARGPGRPPTRRRRRSGSCWARSRPAAGAAKAASRAIAVPLAHSRQSGGGADGPKSSDDAMRANGSRKRRGTAIHTPKKAGRELLDADKASNGSSNGRTKQALFSWLAAVKQWARLDGPESGGDATQLSGMCKRARKTTHTPKEAERSIRTRTTPRRHTGGGSWRRAATASARTAVPRTRGRTSPGLRMGTAGGGCGLVPWASRPSRAAQQAHCHRHRAPLLQVGCSGKHAPPRRTGARLGACTVPPAQRNARDGATPRWTGGPAP